MSKLLSINELRDLNINFLSSYNDTDKLTMEKIASLKALNDYDAYLIVCALCNYKSPKLNLLRNDLLYTRTVLYDKLDSNIDYSHSANDYVSTISSIKCENLHQQNKYGLYEYSISSIDKNLVSRLWSFKNIDCLKYVAIEDTRIVVSISRSQIYNFISALDNLNISYNLNNLLEGLVYNNTSNNILVDYTKYTLPFTPYDFQIDDAKYVVSKKRALLGHEMGCISGDALVEIIYNNQQQIISLEELFKLYTISNATIQIKALNIDKFEFMPIKAVLDKGIKQVIKISTKTTSIKCTFDHEILTDQGWIAAEKLNINNKIAISNDQLSYDIITNIEYLDKENVYDVVIDHFSIRNFVANNIVVHNCGKTFISVLVGESIDTKKLVICPESLRLNWQKEILQVDPTLDVQILYSNEEYHTGKDWTIIGYITATKFLNQLKEFECIFIDEVHNCKAVSNWGKPTSKRASAVIELTNNAEYCYLLSGTPVPSHNRDLFNILKMLKCQEFDFNNVWAFSNFGKKYCDPKITPFGTDYSGNSNSDELHELLDSLMIRRRKAEVLPNLIKQRQFIPIAPKLTRDYKNIEKRLYKPEANDTYMGLAMTGRKLLSELKLDTAIELAENIINGEESVVIVTNFVSTADKLKEHFKNTACEIRGGMSDKDKEKAIKEFQNKKRPVCILNMQAGGVGITLTAASKMIMMDYAWIPADNLQTEDRICRSGQTELCTIYYIYTTNSIFDKIFINMISDKSVNISLVVDDEESDYNLTEIKDNSSTYLDRLKNEIKKTK